MICLFFRFGQILKFLHLLIARSPKNPRETLATPDGRRQFQGDTQALSRGIGRKCLSMLAVIMYRKSQPPSLSALPYLNRNAKIMIKATGKTPKGYIDPDRRNTPSQKPQRTIFEEREV